MSEENSKKTSEKIIKISGYYTTTDLTSRFKISKMTLWRWVNRDENPMPQPRLKGSGSTNRWAIEDIEAWENGQNN